MDNDVAAFRAHLDSISATLATKADIEMLRADIRKMSATGRRWMVASLIGMFVGFVGLHFAAKWSLQSKPAAAQPAPRAPSPVVIYILQPQPPRK